MSVEIPMKNLPSFTMEIVLDNIPYILRFDYNSRGVFWTISFYDIVQTPLVVGIKMVLHYELISDIPDRGLPPGELWVFDVTGNLNPPGRLDFVNNRLNLIYYTEAELELENS